MAFFRKKKNEQIPIARNSTAFDKAFEKRLGQTPIYYVANKMAHGSDIGAIRNLFDILSAEIELQSRCKSPGFDFYYAKALEQKLLAPSAAAKPMPTVTKAFAASQLIGKERFLQQYGRPLKSLAGNREFMKFVREIRLLLSGKEVSNTPEANKQIADYFYKSHANEQFSEVKEITEAVVLSVGQGCGKCVCGGG